MRHPSRTTARAVATRQIDTTRIPAQAVASGSGEGAWGGFIAGEAGLVEPADS
jgi:hypothetical protein